MSLSFIQYVCLNIWHANAAAPDFVFFGVFGIFIENLENALYSTHNNMIIIMIMIIVMAMMMMFLLRMALAM